MLKRFLILIGALLLTATAVFAVFYGEDQIFLKVFNGSNALNVVFSSSGAASTASNTEQILNASFNGSNALRVVCTSGCAGTGTVTAVSGTAGQISVATGNSTPVLSITSPFAFPGSAQLAASAYADLGTPADGTLLYCSDCDAPITQGAVCASVGAKAGAEAHRVRGTWQCY